MIDSWRETVADFSVGAGELTADLSAGGWPLTSASKPCEPPLHPSSAASSGEIVVSAMRWSSPLPSSSSSSLDPDVDAQRPLVVWADDHADTRELVAELL